MCVYVCQWDFVSGMSVCVCVMCVYVMAGVLCVCFIPTVIKSEVKNTHIYMCVHVYVCVVCVHAPTYTHTTSGKCVCIGVYVCSVCKQCM